MTATRRSLRTSAPARISLTQLAGLSDQSQRAAAIATAGGLLTATLTGVAVPAAHSTTTLDLSAIVSQARAALATAPAVETPLDAQVLIDGVSAADLAQVSVTPAPEPEPAPAPEPEPAAPSRSEDRAPAPQRPAPQPAPPVVEAPAPAPMPPSAIGSAVVEVAARYVGVPYVWGGTTPAGFDCSGFVQYVFGQLGVSLPRTDAGIRAAGVVVPASDAQPGDIVWTPGHVAIYAGGGIVIDAPQPGGTVQFHQDYHPNPTYIRIG